MLNPSLSLAFHWTVSYPFLAIQRFATVQSSFVTGTIVCIASLSVPGLVRCFPVFCHYQQGCSELLVGQLKLLFMILGEQIPGPHPTS